MLVICGDAFPSPFLYFFLFLVLHSGEDFHPTSNSLIHGTHVPTNEGIDRMVEDVEKQ